MNQAFEVNNTTNDITHSGPVAQELALHKGSTLIADVGSLHNTPLSMGAVKQAVLGSTIIVDIINAGGIPGNIQNFNLDKATGAPNGSVARDLVDQLNFKRVGDCALLHFFACNRLPVGSDLVAIGSDDTSVLQPGNTLLYDGSVAIKRGGEAVAEIRAVNVTPGAEIVSLFVSENNAFV
uniref:Uncharacterized protein n=1 Tax=Iridovirus LCIVAC01 TaxID=2506607 RepID=A0A481YQ54_9VIRU|nr:MAG: hypothetical protein LCIVAC01_01170 [Iridovirus LCIVAC01]